MVLMLMMKLISFSQVLTAGGSTIMGFAPAGFEPNEQLCIIQWEGQVSRPTVCMESND